MRPAGDGGGADGACGDTAPCDWDEDGIPDCTQSVDPDTLLAGNTVECAEPGQSTASNGLARAFAVPDDGLSVECVDFGVESNQGGAWPVRVNIYRGDINGPFDGLTLLGTSDDVLIPDNTSLEFFTASFPEPVFVPGGATMVVEVFVPSRDPGQGGDGGRTFIGSNNLGEFAPSYLRAPDCGFGDFLDYGGLGFPDVHLVLTVHVPNAELHVALTATGPDCCWTFDVWQVWGVRGNIDEVVVDVIPPVQSPAATVVSATSCSGTPAPTYTIGGTTISWPFPSGLPIVPNSTPECIRFCLKSTSTIPPTVRFQAYRNGAPLPFFYQRVDVTLDDPMCEPCCLVDCNGNGVHDLDDLASGFSVDLNGNGILDECESSCGSQAETIILRSGQVNGQAGTAGAPDDSITYLTAGNPDQCFADPLTLSFPPGGFTTSAVVVDPYPGWIGGLASDMNARWINWHESNDWGTPPHSVLYAHPFTVNTPAVGPTKITFAWSVDDSLGDPSPAVPGVYINGVAIPLLSGGNHQSESGPFTALVPPNTVVSGANTLYVYQRDLGCAASGVIYSAKIDVCPCDLICTPAMIDENEPCFARLNDGCDIQPVQFGSISCGDTICGSIWNNGATRDVDAFLVTTGAPCTELVSVLKSESSCSNAILDLTGGCAHRLYLSTDGESDDCVNIKPAVARVGPGTYGIYVFPSSFTGNPCGADDNDYQVTLECKQCTRGACCHFDATGNLVCTTETEAGCITLGGAWDPFATCEDGYSCLCSASDLDGDGVVGFSDLLIILGSWGPCEACPADLDGDGIVGFSDLIEVLSDWGPC